MHAQWTRFIFRDSSIAHCSSFIQRLFLNRIHFCRLTMLGWMLKRGDNAPDTGDGGLMPTMKLFSRNKALTSEHTQIRRRLTSQILQHRYLPPEPSKVPCLARRQNELRTVGAPEARHQDGLQPPQDNHPRLHQSRRAFFSRQGLERPRESACHSVTMYQEDPPLTSPK